MSQSTVPPLLLIQLAVEAAPVVLIHAMNEGQEQRVWDWINAHEEYRGLVEFALELAAERPAA